MMTHRGVDLLPVLLGVLGWISFIISALVNQVSLLWPNALGPVAFSLYLIGLTVLTGRSVDLIGWVLGRIGLGSVIFFVSQGIELTRMGRFLFLWKYGVAPPATIVLLLFVMVVARSGRGCRLASGGSRTVQPGVELPLACPRVPAGRGDSVDSGGLR